MAVHLSVAVRNAMLDAIETTISTTPKLRLYSGSVPADCAASLGAAVLLAELTLPSNWMADASNGQKVLAGTWSGQATTGGTASFYRIYDSAGTTCHEQGTVGLGSGDLSLDNNVIASGQTITITTFTKNAPNA